LLATINVSSPRRLDDRMLGTLKAYARANQIVMLTPFILAGAMGPAAVLGTVAQANAEALAGIVFAQMVRPGTPCIYGPFLAVVDLQSGAPVFGAAESIHAQLLAAQMARHYALPFRAAGSYVSGKQPDSQSGIEAALSMFPSMLTRPNFVLHAAGWMENGLTTSYEKFMLDLEMLGVFHRYAQGISWDDDEWALEAVLEEVPPGGHHLGTQHTLARFRTAFHRPELFDYDSFEQWKAAGAVGAEERAAQSWPALLERYEQPPLDDAIDEELQDYIARRRTEIDPADFQ
jgi:trimethylamine--corrinoid protein Co-methyltransferase